jgi:putative oxidoreductase
MPAESQAILWVIGRLLLGGLFVVGGIHHFFMLPGITQALAARGVPAAKLVLLFGSVAFTLAASVLLVNFWSMEGSARANAIATWQSNLAIIGGLLVAAAYSL